MALAVGIKDTGNHLLSVSEYSSILSRDQLWVLQAGMLTDGVGC